MIGLDPLVPTAEGWSVPEAELRALYAQMRAEGTYKRTWRVGPDTVEGWLAYLRTPTNHVTVVRLDGRPVAVAWLNGLCPHAGFVHHWFSRAVWGPLAMRIARALLDFWFSIEGPQGPLLRVLIGQTPADNRPALAFAARTGFELLGAIPYVDGPGTVISFLTRERHYGRD